MDIDNSEELLEKVSEVVHMSDVEKEKMKSEAKNRLKRYDTARAGKKLEEYYRKILCICGNEV